MAWRLNGVVWWHKSLIPLFTNISFISTHLHQLWIWNFSDHCKKSTQLKLSCSNFDYHVSDCEMNQLSWWKQNALIENNLVRIFRFRNYREVTNSKTKSGKNKRKGVKKKKKKRRDAWRSKKKPPFSKMDHSFLIPGLTSSVAFFYFWYF